MGVVRRSELWLLTSLLLLLLEAASRCVRARSLWLACRPLVLNADPLALEVVTLGALI